MIVKRESCEYCNEKMESVTAKKRFCSAKCRIYFNREKARKEGNTELPTLKPIEPPKVAAVNITPEQSKEVLEGAKKATKTKFTVNQPKPGSFAAFLKGEGDLK